MHVSSCPVGRMKKMKTSLRLLATALALLLLSQIQVANSFQTPRLAAVSSSKSVLSSAQPVFQSSIADLPTTVPRESVSKQPTTENDLLPLGTILRMLPRESFEIDTKTGLFYFGVDLVAVGATLGFLNAVVTSDFYHSIPVWMQALTVAPLQVLVSVRHRIIESRRCRACFLR